MRSEDRRARVLASAGLIETIQEQEQAGERKAEDVVEFLLVKIVRMSVLRFILASC